MKQQAPASEPSSVAEFGLLLSSTRRGARLARTLAVQQLAEWCHVPHDSDTARAVALVTAELASNAVAHGRRAGRGLPADAPPPAPRVPRRGDRHPPRVTAAPHRRPTAVRRRDVGPRPAPRRRVRGPLGPHHPRQPPPRPCGRRCSSTPPRSLPGLMPQTTSGALRAAVTHEVTTGQFRRAGGSTAAPSYALVVAVRGGAVRRGERHVGWPIQVPQGKMYRACDHTREPQRKVTPIGGDEDPWTPRTADHASYTTK
ncbi:hypothetical protein SALBM135S_02510 [Streptomyces alboniger]